MTTGQPQSGKADAEEGPAPFVEHHLDTAAAVSIRGFDDIAGCVARPGERRCELAVCGLGRRGRREAEGRLAGHMEPVLEAAECADRFVFVEQVGGSSDRLQPDERVRELVPELADLGCVALPRLCFGRRHPGMLARLASSTIAGLDAAARSILLVEDDAALRLVCRVNLELDGFPVREATGLDEARIAVAVERPSLVFLDLHLGSGASDDLLDELRADGIPVVLVSGTVDVSGYEGRASAVMPKPFDPDELLEAARRYSVG